RSISPLEATNEARMVWREAAIETLGVDEDELPPIEEAIDMLRSRFNGKDNGPPPVSTGLVDVDAKLNGGLRPGSLSIIAAESGFGKTACMLGLSRGAAERGPVLYVSCEMGREELLLRLTSGEANVPSSSLQTAILSPNARARADAALNVLSK